jgi:Flp pilus assembly pilin Flp
VERRGQRGGGIIEYALIYLMLIALAILLLHVFGDWLVQVYQSILHAL